MKVIPHRRWLLSIYFIISGCAVNSQALTLPLKIAHLVDSFYVYTTYGDAGGGYIFPANGMYVVTPEGSLLIDTPWDSTQFQPLLDSINSRHHSRVVACIATHFHEDRTAGLTYYGSRGIRTYSTARTDSLSMTYGKPRANYVIPEDTSFVFGNSSFHLFFPGWGHSPDNIVIWWPDHKILYGGCFIKSVESRSVGNLSNANVDQWLLSLKRVKKKFSGAEYIITGHQSWLNKEAIDYSIQLLNTYKRKK